MSTRTEQSWSWGEINPTERCVAGAFSGHIGNVEAGDISSELFVTSMTEAFSDITTEDVLKTGGWTGKMGLQNMIVNKLAGYEIEPIHDTTQTLATLAGGEVEQIDLANKAEDLILSGRHHDAIPILTELSVQAANNR